MELRPMLAFKPTVNFNSGFVGEIKAGTAHAPALVCVGSSPKSLMGYIQPASSNMPTREPHVLFGIRPRIMSMMTKDI